MKTPSTNPTKIRRKRPSGRRRERPQLLRFDQIKGKRVEFVELSIDPDFPCIDIGLEDQTGLRFVMDERLTITPTYSDWKSGNERVLRSWKALEIGD